MIIVSGMIGTGKTTYVKALEEQFASRAFYESVDNNPLLSKFYAEPDTYAFSSQAYFALTRFSAIKEASQQPRWLVDRGLHEDMLFAQVNHDLGRITKEDKMVYDLLTSELLTEIKNHYSKHPYLLIYLRASFETILARIKLRNRDFEQDPALLEYYRTLHVRYDDWMYKNHYNEHIITIDTDKLDILNPNDKKIIMDEISLKLLAIGL